jgi:hypothetical protein
VELVPFILLFGLICAINYRYYRTRYANHLTFEQYQARFPGLVKKGRVECHICGGTRLHVRGLWSAGDTRKTHYCSTCGKPLYRSRH